MTSCDECDTGLNVKNRMAKLAVYTDDGIKPVYPTRLYNYTGKVGIRHTFILLWVYEGCKCFTPYVVL